MADFVNAGRLLKATDWVRLYDFDFINFTELATETISSVVGGAPTVTGSDSALVLSGTIIAGTKVQFQLAGGTAGVPYTIYCKINTSGGHELSQVGYLEVFNPTG